MRCKWKILRKIERSVGGSTWKRLGVEWWLVCAGPRSLLLVALAHHTIDVVTPLINLPEIETCQVRITRSSESAVTKLRVQRNTTERLLFASMSMKASQWFSHVHIKTARYMVAHILNLIFLCDCVTKELNGLFRSGATEQDMVSGRDPNKAEVLVKHDHLTFNVFAVDKAWLCNLSFARISKELRCFAVERHLQRF